MPTISQLPPTSQANAADLVPISQGGAVCSVSVGTLLAGTQPAILAPSGTLLGRTSLGPGGPDNIGVGLGLLLNSDTLIATGADHADFPALGTLSLTDQAVLSSSGNPKLLPLSLLRALFSAGSNVSIDQNGTISSTVQPEASSGSSDSITDLPTVSTISSGDLVAISQGGVDHTITYANLLDGETIDQAQVAGAAADTDTFWTAQSGNVMVRQSLAAIWAWVITKLPNYLLPTVELTSNTSLNASAHNGRILICSQPITLTATVSSVANGFTCNVINASAGTIVLGNGLTAFAGMSTLASGQAASIACVKYSGGTLIYAWTNPSPPSSAVPAQVRAFSP